MLSHQSNPQLLVLPENQQAWKALEKHAGGKTKSKVALIYLTGPPGTGKSLLVSHFLREYTRNHHRCQTDQITASGFAARLADASDAGTIDSFQSSFRQLDLFVCEDLQSLRGRRESLKQLVLGIDAIAERGGLVVFTATSLPGHWSGFNARLVDRCHAGLSLSIELPARGSRERLVEHFFQRHHLPVPTGAIQAIATREDLSPRDLEALVARMADYARQSKTKLSDELIHRLLLRETSGHEPSLAEIVRTTARYFDLKIRELKSDSRRADIVFARQCAMYLARDLTDQPQKKIAAALGMADHTSVIRAVNKIRNSLDENAETRRKLAEIRQSLQHH